MWMPTPCTAFCASWSQVALEYLLKGPTGSGGQVTAEVKAKLSDEHVKVCYLRLLSCPTLGPPTAVFAIDLRNGVLGNVAWAADIQWCVLSCAMREILRSCMCACRRNCPFFCKSYREYSLLRRGLFLQRCARISATSSCRRGHE